MFRRRKYREWTFYLHVYMNEMFLHASCYYSIIIKFQVLVNENFFLLE